MLCHWKPTGNTPARLCCFACLLADPWGPGAGFCVKAHAFPHALPTQGDN